MKNRYILILCLLAGFIIYSYYTLSKKTATFDINPHKGFQMISLNTDGSSDDMFSTVVCEIQGEINQETDVLLARHDIPLNEQLGRIDTYRFRLKKGKIDTTIRGDWYTNKARLLFRFPSNCKGNLKGFVRINN
jgi:hypothetical protein